jgi:ParB family chromosome partitioning protein
MSEIVSIPLNKLVRSQRNVRKTGGESIDDLAASILAHGLLHNLTVVEQRNHTGTGSVKYEVVAGARRYAALQRLAKEKKLPKTCDVPCKVVEASAAVEASLAENTIRVAMHPADQFIAFRDLVDSGLGIEDVAARFGVSPLFVRQRLKLANISPRFIEAYRAGEMQLEQLEASQSPMTTTHRNGYGRVPNMSGNAALIIFGGYSPKNRLALPIAGLGLSVSKLISPLAAPWNETCSMPNTKDI